MESNIFSAEQDEDESSLDGLHSRFLENDYAKKIAASASNNKNTVEDFVSKFCWEIVTKSGIANYDTLAVTEILQMSLIKTMKNFFSEETIKNIESKFDYDAFIEQKDQEAKRRKTLEEDISYKN